MSDLDDALADAADSVLSIAGNAITYTPKGGSPIETTGYRTGEAQQSVDVGGVVRVLVDECDYTVPFADLDDEPRRGDQIVETIHGVEHRFEVLPVDKSQCFVWVDPKRTQVLIHVKRVPTS